MSEALKSLIEQWSILKNAPWQYWLFLFFCMAIVFSVLEYRQKERLVKKEDEIKLLQRQSEQKKAELDTTEKGLNRYRNMILLNPEKNTLYTQMTHEELRIRALNLVLKMRESSRLTKQKEREASTNYHLEITKEDDHQKKVDVLNKYIRISSKIADDLMAEYKRKYKSEAILMRNEILSRLPENAEEKNRAVLGASIEHYELAINAFIFEAVTDNLARLAMSLPQ